MSGSAEVSRVIATRADEAETRLSANLAKAGN
jgi:hypothetical protein